MERLAKQIEGMEFDWYVAISRGGLVPACLLSQITGHRAIDTVSVHSYEGDQAGEPVYVHKEYLNLQGKKILVIDDLVDTGDTRYVSSANLAIRQIREQLGSATAKR